MSGVMTSTTETVTPHLLRRRDKNEPPPPPPPVLPSWQHFVLTESKRLINPGKKRSCGRHDTTRAQNAQTIKSRVLTRLIMGVSLLLEGGVWLLPPGWRMHVNDWTRGPSGNCSLDKIDAKCFLYGNNERTTVTPSRNLKAVPYEPR